MTDLIERLRAATMGFDWSDLPDDALIPAVPLLREAATALSQEREARDDWFEFCEMMGENLDTQEAVAYSINAKIGNLEASLAEAKRLLKPFADMAEREAFAPSLSASCRAAARFLS